MPRPGELIWENRIGPVVDNLENASRTMALYGNLLFYGATSATIHALDARTGKEVWHTVISTYKDDKVGGMTVIHGKLVVGLTRCDDRSVQDHCWIAAYDTATGKQIWKTLTIADKGTQGGDSWGNLTNDQRAGADAWITGSYDPEPLISLTGAPARPSRHAATSAAPMATPCSPTPHWRSIPTAENCSGITRTRRGNRWTWMRSMNVC